MSSWVDFRAQNWLQVMHNNILTICLGTRRILFDSKNSNFNVPFVKNSTFRLKRTVSVDL